MSDLERRASALSEDFAGLLPLIHRTRVPRWDTGRMCTLCSETQDVLLSEVERLVVLAEADAGLGDPAARRPLSEAERASGARFSEITALEDEYLAAVTPVLEGLRGVVDAEILAALAGASTASALLDALEGLNAAPPTRVLTTATDAAEHVQDALQAVYRGASEVALREAGRQGVPLLHEPLEPRLGAYEVAARRVAAEPYARSLEVLRRQATSPQVLVGEVLDADLVPAALANYDNAGVLDLARQFSHSALGSARTDTFAVIPQAATYYASELLDGNQCGPCAAVDGREYASLNEARQDYPNGPMTRCEGGARCRGTLVAVYQD